MGRLAKWFGVGIIIVIIAEVLINLFLFPQLPREVQVTVAYITNVIALVLGLFVSLACTLGSCEIRAFESSQEGLRVCEETTYRAERV